MAAVMIGVDPHKLSNTMVVIDASETVLAQHRFTNDRAGYQQLKAVARGYRDRTWAVEGAQGVGLGLAQRLVAEGEPVVNVHRSSRRGSARSVVAAGARPTTPTPTRSRSPGCARRTCTSSPPMTPPRCFGC
jgi:hypothetical protein